MKRKNAAIKPTRARAATPAAAASLRVFRPRVSHPSRPPPPPRPFEGLAWFSQDGCVPPKTPTDRLHYVYAPSATRKCAHHREFFMSALAVYPTLLTDARSFVTGFRLIDFNDYDDDYGDGG